MSPNEAIGALKLINLKGVHPFYDWEEMLEVRDTAIKALEKQIPKKPEPFERTAHDFLSDVCKHSHYPCEHIKPFNHEYKYTDYKCPVCSKLTKEGTPRSCCHCGQALDWSDTE